jgi:hypothetical protein
MMSASSPSTWWPARTSCSGVSPDWNDPRRAAVAISRAVRPPIGSPGLGGIRRERLPEYLVGEVDSTAGRCEEAEERHARAMEFVRTPRNWLSSPEGRQVLGRARSVSRVQAVPCRDEPHDHRAQEHPKGDAWHRRNAHDVVEEPIQVNQQTGEQVGREPDQDAALPRGAVPAPGRPGTWRQRQQGGGGWFGPERSPAGCSGCRRCAASLKEPAGSQGRTRPAG